MKKVRSLRLRATLLICGLILVVVVTYAATAYQQMRRAAVQSAAGQLAPVPGALAGVFANAAAQMRELAAAYAADPAVVAYVAAPDSTARNSALTAIPSSTPLRGELHTRPGGGGDTGVRR